MIVQPYIREFEACGLGLFVHFGVYSVLGKGEWAKACLPVQDEAYLQLAHQFNPKENWAWKLAAAARGAGAKYITLTARHHDGFSLYDTQDLSDYDAPHFCGRDLVKEFVDACRVEGLKPFFYHTLLDWHHEDYRTNFPRYLSYLRSSVEMLCTNYGPIGGIWFDGMWDNFSADWQEDALYSLIRRHQPEAMIINNTGMDAMGALGHIELDSVTFERGSPKPINLEGSPKYIASEMCQVMNDHWGWGNHDLNYKNMREILKDLAACRRVGANYLLNVGPMADGSLRLMDRGILETLGQWVTLNQEALHSPRPTGIEVIDHKEDFILQGNKAFYLFVVDAPMYNNPNGDRIEEFQFEKEIAAVWWLDSGEPLPFSQSGKTARITALPFQYGSNLVVRVAKIAIK